MWVCDPGSSMLALMLYYHSSNSNDHIVSENLCFKCLPLNSPCQISESNDSSAYDDDDPFDVGKISGMCVVELLSIMHVWQWWWIIVNLKKSKNGCCKNFEWFTCTKNKKQQGTKSFFVSIL